MRRFIGIGVAVALLFGLAGFVQAAEPDKDGFISLFDGKSLDGWKASENPKTFKVEDGQILVDGPRAHLFYVGPVKEATFKNFHFKAEVMTWPKANSGIYIHTKYQENGWPSAGYECQVNNSHSDWRRTASVYGVKDVREQLVKDNEWFLYEIIVNGKQITIKINGKTVNEYTEPDNTRGARRLTSGTIALQGHDPESKIAYKNIMIKPLED